MNDKTRLTKEREKVIRAQALAYKYDDTTWGEMRKANDSVLELLDELDAVRNERDYRKGQRRDMTLTAVVLLPGTDAVRTANGEYFEMRNQAEAKRLDRWSREAQSAKVKCAEPGCPHEATIGGTCALHPDVRYAKRIDAPFVLRAPDEPLDRLAAQAENIATLQARCERLEAWQRALIDHAEHHKCCELTCALFAAGTETIKKEKE